MLFMTFTLLSSRCGILTKHASAHSAAIDFTPPIMSGSDHARLLRTTQILILRGNALRGRLPAWLDQLPFLRHVDLADNFFEGLVPASLATLPHLEVLLLHGNKLDGVSPLCLSRWVLKSLQIVLLQ